MLYADERCYLRWSNDAVRYVGIPYREQKARRLDEELEKSIPAYAIVSLIVTPAFSRVRLAGDRADAHIAGVRTLLALAAYKDRFGSYPPSLDALKERLGWKLPIDPFSGEDLVYRQQGRGFLLYSIGENLKDDGAKPFMGTINVPEGYDYRDGNGHRVADIIWQMDH
jgi:hypothetical protein